MLPKYLNSKCSLKWPDKCSHSVAVLFILSVNLVVLVFALFFSLPLRGKKRNENLVFLSLWIYANSKLGKENLDYLFSLLSPSSVTSKDLQKLKKIEFRLNFQNGMSDIKMQVLLFCLRAFHFKCQMQPTSKSNVFERWVGGWYILFCLCTWRDERLETENSE